LASSLELRETLQQLTREIVPRFADWCTIAVLDENGVMRRVAGHHVDTAKEPAMRAYLAGFPSERHPSSPMTDSVNAGTSYCAPNVTDEMLVATAQDQAHLAILRELGCKATIVAPLLVRGQSIGAFSMCMSGERKFTDLDEQLARELGALIGLAVDNARRLDAERGARERAERAEAAKDEFLAMLGHELRNPLAPIVSAIDLLKLRNAAPARELGVIERQTKHLVRLVDDLLDVSRIARGLVTLEKKPVDTVDVVQRAVEMTESLVTARHQKLTLEVPPGLVLDADPERIAQVLTNLLTNAAKYTQPEGTIAVSARNDGDMIVITVRDSGMGIAPDMLPRIFDMFVQHRQPLDRSGGGLGLGLTIVKSLVEAHGGRVEVRSAGQGRGTEFELHLPASRQQPQRGTAATQTPQNVLVVDDNEDAAMLMADSLERAGYVTRVAHDAGEAIAVVRDWRPHAAILDIGLPVIDGYELARRLRAQPGLGKLFLIALTGYGQAADRERALAAGFDHHLVKPVTSAAIRAVLDAIPASR
ncbi:MAG: response regulator, partial [Deltaproteobacteria bacterium]|nr:response regulator [Deltaproteobacteria bacterium]